MSWWFDQQPLAASRETVAAAAPDVDAVVVSEAERATASGCLAARRAALAAIPAERVARPRVSAERCVALAVAVRTRAAAAFTHPWTLHPEAFAEIKAMAQALPEDALAYLAAQTAWEEGVATPGSAARARLVALRDKVREHDRVLTLWARPAFGDHPAEGAVLADIIPGTGHIDNARDVIALVAMFRRHADGITAKTPIDAAMLAAAEADATELLVTEEAAETPDGRRDLVARAFTAFAERFEMVTRAGRFLAPAFDWPGLGAGMARRPAAGSGQVAPANPAPVDADADVPSA